jgi:hydrogenase expression/formation protein HypD
MKFIDEFRDKELARGLIEKIRKTSTRAIQLMEVCGTHTVSIFRYGIKGVLPEHIKLLSGPGCPVCVTPNANIDLAMALARQKDVILVTFGDMMRVPGSTSSLMKEKAKGADVRIVYSSLDALSIARKHLKKRVVFLAIGFETTSPTIAVAFLRAKEEKLRNLYFLNSQKRVPSALRVLLQSKRVNINGFILPGHVSTILGTGPFQFIADEFARPGVVTGFEPLDILQGIWMLIKQIEEGRHAIEIQYRRVVREEGNPLALRKIYAVFDNDQALWRGFGPIPGSGYRIREIFKAMDAGNLDVDVEQTVDHPGCLCGEVLQGVKSPLQCVLFKAVCHPENPVGPCMVSMEGTCHTYFKFHQS